MLPRGSVFNGVGAGDCPFREIDGRVVNVPGEASVAAGRPARIARRRSIGIVIDAALEGRCNRRMFARVGAEATSADPGPVSNN